MTDGVAAASQPLPSLGVGFPSRAALAAGSGGRSPRGTPRRSSSLTVAVRAGVFAAGGMPAGGSLRMKPPSLRSGVVLDIFSACFNSLLLIRRRHEASPHQPVQIIKLPPRIPLQSCHTMSTTIVSFAILL